MFSIDPFVILVTAFTLIPILQIDGTKIDIQIVFAILKILFLAMNMKII